MSDSRHRRISCRRRIVVVVGYVALPRLRSPSSLFRLLSSLVALPPFPSHFSFSLPFSPFPLFLFHISFPPFPLSFHPFFPPFPLLLLFYLASSGGGRVVTGRFGPVSRCYRRVVQVGSALRCRRRRRHRRRRRVEQVGSALHCRRVGSVVDTIREVLWSTWKRVDLALSNGCAGRHWFLLPLIEQFTILLRTKPPAFDLSWSVCPSGGDGR